MLVAQATQDPWQQAGHQQGDDRECPESQRGLSGRPAPRIDRRQEDGGHGDPHEVLDDAPAEEGDLGRLVGRASSADGDVDDDDRRREGDAQPDEGGRDRFEPAEVERDAGDDGRQDRLRRRRPEDGSMVAPEPRQVDLDADLEQEQDDADVREELQLLMIGDIARRERREGEADGQVADDGGEMQPTSQPAGRDRSDQDQADLEDGRRRGVHLAMVPGSAGVAQTGVGSASSEAGGGSPRNAPTRQAMRIAIAVIATTIVEMALISGETPNLIAL